MREHYDDIVECLIRKVASPYNRPTWYKEDLGKADELLPSDRW